MMLIISHFWKITFLMQKIADISVMQKIADRFESLHLKVILSFYAKITQRTSVPLPVLQLTAVQSTDSPIQHPTVQTQSKRTDFCHVGKVYQISFPHHHCVTFRLPMNDVISDNKNLTYNTKIQYKYKMVPLK